MFSPERLGIGVIAKQAAPGSLVRPRRCRRNHRIAQDREIGAAACAIDRISGIGLSRIEER